MTLIKQIKLFLINVFSGVQVKQKRNRERQLTIAEMVHRTNKQIFFFNIPSISAQNARACYAFFRSCYNIVQRQPKGK